MRFKALNTAFFMLSVSTCFGQQATVSGVNRTFHLTNVATPRALQELATVLRTVGDIGNLSVEGAASTVSVSATPADIALAEWLIHEMDQPGDAPPSVRQIRETAVHEFSVPGTKDDMVRMFYLSHMDSTRSMQELLTVLRTVGQVQKVFNYTALTSLAVRGTSDKIAWVAWAIHELDGAPGTQTAGTHEFRSPDKWVPVSRIFYLNNHTDRDMQQTLTALRTKIPIRYVFNFTQLGALVVGGSSEDIERAAQLIQQRDQIAAR